MSLDLLNANMLDDDFSNFTNNSRVVSIYATGLPRGERLEDDFGAYASRNTPSFNDILSQSNIVEANIFDAGDGNFYESTPYGYYLNDEEFSNYIIKEFENFANGLKYGFDSEVYSQGIGDWFSKATSNIGKAFSDAGKSITDAAKTVTAKAEKDIKDAAKSVKDAAKEVKEKGLGKALENLGKETQKLASDAAKNIKGTIEDARKSISDAYESAKKWVGDNLGGGVALHYLNKVNPVFLALRGAMLGLIALNVVGVASALKVVKDKSQKRWDELAQKWWLWGGEKDFFGDTVESGSKKSKFLEDIVKKFTGKGVDGSYYFSNAGGSNAADIVNMAGTALGLVSGALAMIPAPEPTTKAVALWTGIGSAGLGAMGGILKQFAKDEGASEQQTSQMLTGADPKNSEVPKNEAELVKLKEEIELAKQGKVGMVDAGVKVNPDGTINAKITPDGKVAAPVNQEAILKTDGTIVTEDGSTLRTADTGATTTTTTKGDKILGMSKPVFYTILAVVVVGGGFLTYKMIKGKK